MSNFPKIAIPGPSKAQQRREYTVAKAQFGPQRRSNRYPNGRPVFRPAHNAMPVQTSLGLVVCRAHSVQKSIDRDLIYPVLKRARQAKKALLDQSKEP